MRCLSIIFLLLFSVVVLQAQDRSVQTIEQRGDYFKLVKLKVRKNTFYTNLDPGFTATSVSVETPADLNPLRALLYLGSSAKYALSEETHMENDTVRNEELFHSQLIIAPEPFRYFSFFSGDLEGPVFFKLLYAKPLGRPASALKKKR